MMNEHDAIIFREIHEPTLANLLLDPATLRQLEPFWGVACSVSHAAEQLGDKPNTVLARVRRFVALGILEHSHSQQRAGRAIKLYRTTSEGFFIPFEATSAPTLVDALLARDMYYQRILTEAVVRTRAAHLQHQPYGTRIYKDIHGHLQLQSACSPATNYNLLDDDAPSALSLWRDTLRLEPEDAKALQQELFAIFKRYRQKEGSQRYLLRLGLAPLEYE